MIYPSADKLEGWGSKYALVTLAAKRAKQLKSGAPPLIETDSRNPLTVALEEIAAGKVICDVPDIDIVAQAVVEPEVAQLLAIPEEPEEETAEALTVAEEEEAGVLEEEEEELEEDELEDEEEDEEEHVPWAIGDIEEEPERTAHPAEDEEEAAPPVDVLPDVEEVVEAPAEEEKPKAKGRRRGKAAAAVDTDLEIHADAESEETAEAEDTDEDV